MPGRCIRLLLLLLLLLLHASMVYGLLTRGGISGVRALLLVAPQFAPRAGCNSRSSCSSSSLYLCWKL
jgi:hypothetical protein